MRDVSFLWAFLPLSGYLLAERRCWGRGRTFLSLAAVTPGLLSPTLGSHFLPIKN